MGRREAIVQSGVKLNGHFRPARRRISAASRSRRPVLVREAGEIFHHAGGKNFSHIPCLNDSAEGMAVIEHMVRRELQGWL